MEDRQMAAGSKLTDTCSKLLRVSQIPLFDYVRDCARGSEFQSLGVRELAASALAEVEW